MFFIQRTPNFQLLLSHNYDIVFIYCVIHKHFNKTVEEDSNSLFLHKTEQKHSITQLHPNIEKVNMLSFHFSSYVNEVMALLQTMEAAALKMSV